LGAAIRLHSDLGPEFLLFHEGPSRIVISTQHSNRVMEIAKQHQVDATGIGKTMPNFLSIANRGRELINVDVRELKQLWKGALERLLHPESHV
jgi:phosphoribosylformylglycinamidine synthase